MKVTVKHNGEILDDFGYGEKEIDDEIVFSNDMEEKIKHILQFRATEDYDFEYGIGGCGFDRYFKIKSIKLPNNNTQIIVKVSEYKG